jgi:nicotinamidase-related amidase
MATALFIVDVQHAQFFGPWAMPDSANLLSRIGNRLLLARQESTPVFHIQNDAPEGELDAPGMPFWQLVFNPAAGERVIRKSSPNVFDDNPYLDAELRHLGISSIEFVGVQSELCLRASALGAKALGYKIVLARDLHGSFNSDDQTHSEVSDAVQLELMGGN